MSIELNSTLLTHAQAQAKDAGLTLAYTGDALTLAGGGMALSCNFEGMLKRISPAKLHSELLVRAAKITHNANNESSNDTAHPIAIDATAGLGQDAFLLAAAGFEVYMFEQNAVIAALLSDGLLRATNSEKLAGITSRMHLKCQNSICALQALNFTPDVVYLDPMFAKREKNAATKKKFQLLRKLEAPCTNENELLKAAVCAKPKKVVVKRLPKAEYLACVKPAYNICGKAVRYDCILPKNLSKKTLSQLNPHPVCLTKR